MIIVDGKEVLMALEELAAPAYTALLIVDLQNDYCSTSILSFGSTVY